MTRIARLVLLVCALGLAFGTTTASAATLTPTPDPLLGSNFQGGDGNQADEAGHIDWQTLAQVPAGQNGFVASAIDSQVHDSCFGSPNQKQLNPGGWVFIDCGTGVNPSKDNLLAGFSSVDHQGDTFLYLAFTREAQTGNTYLAFELNQRQDTFHNPAGFDVPCRTDGDLIISYQVNSGVSPPNVDVIVHQWHTLTADSATGCALTGSVTELDPQPFAEGAVNATAITNYLTPAPTFAEGTFGEVALNLTGFFNSILGSAPCFNFGSISMESHASTSFTSDLKDFIGPIPLTVANCQINVDKQVRVRDGNTPSDPTSDTYADSASAVAGSTFDYKFDVSVPAGSPSLQLTSISDVLGTDPADPAYCTPDPFLGANAPHNYGDLNDNDLIDPGEHWLFTCAHTSTVADVGNSPLHNTVFVEGQIPNCEGSVQACGASDSDDANASVTAQPQLSTTASAAVELGNAIHDTAHLSGGYQPTGTVSFTVYGPNDSNCSGTATVIGSAQVDANGDAVSPGYKPTAPGTYRFVASYSGDANNLAASGHCNDANESVDVLKPQIAIDKTGPARANQGDKVSYTLAVTNPGTVPLIGSTVVVTDEQCNGDPVTLIGKGGDLTPNTLDPGDTWSYTCSAQTVAGQTSLHNVASVTGCDRLGGCVSASDFADTILDALIVEPTRVPGASARLLGPTGCVAKVFNARVRGLNVATVTFILDGKVIKKVSNTSNASLIVARINPAKLKLGVHRLVANVTYRAETQKKAQSFRLSFQRCSKKLVKPRFTG